MSVNNTKIGVKLYSIWTTPQVVDWAPSRHAAHSDKPGTHSRSSLALLERSDGAARVGLQRLLPRN
jgi:hypothetical protein